MRGEVEKKKRTARNFRIGKKRKISEWWWEGSKRKSVHCWEDRFEPLHWPVNS
jgi:hypothetical protein